MKQLGFIPGSREESEWRGALIKVFSAIEGQVCNVCGLGGVGHAPESRWLGYERHVFAGRPATRAELQRARELTSIAYSKRDSDIHCGHKFAGKNCADNCIHIGGHCENCWGR